MSENKTSGTNVANKKGVAKIGLLLSIFFIALAILSNPYSSFAASLVAEDEVKAVLADRDEHVKIIHKNIDDLTEEQLKNMKQGNIEEKMSWLNGESGDFEYITAFTMVYKAKKAPAAVNTDTPAMSLKAQPKTGDTSSILLSGVILFLATGAFILLMKKRKSGKYAAVAVIMLSGLVITPSVFAAEQSLIGTVENEDIRLDSTFTKEGKSTGEFEYVGYYPEIASEPTVTEEVINRDVYGSVKTRYINEATGEEIISGGTIVDNKVVAQEKVKVTKDFKGNVIEEEVLERTPTNLTYSTKEDAAAKAETIKDLKTDAVKWHDAYAYDSMPSGEVKNGVAVGAYDQISYETVYKQVDNPSIGLGLDCRKHAVEHGFDFDKDTTEEQIQLERIKYDPSNVIFKQDVKFTTDVISYRYVFRRPVKPENVLVNYEFARVEGEEAGNVNEGETIVTYYYMPKTLEINRIFMSIESTYVDTLAHDF